MSRNTQIAKNNFYDNVKEILQTAQKESLDILRKEEMLVKKTKTLEQKIQEFLLELGRGFAFVARQKRIKTELRKS